MKSAALPGQDPEADRGLIAFLRDLGAFLLKSILKMGMDLESFYKLLSETGIKQAERLIKRQGGRYFVDVVKKWLILSDQTDTIYNPRSWSPSHQKPRSSGKSVPVFFHVTRLENEM